MEAVQSFEAQLTYPGIPLSGTCLDDVDRLLLAAGEVLMGEKHHLTDALEREREAKRRPRHGR